MSNYRCEKSCLSLLLKKLVAMAFSFRFSWSSLLRATRTAKFYCYCLLRSGNFNPLSIISGVSLLLKFVFIYYPDNTIIFISHNSQRWLNDRLLLSKRKLSAQLKFLNFSQLNVLLQRHFSSVYFSSRIRSDRKSILSFR